MVPVGPVLFRPPEPAGPEFHPLLLFALGLVIGYLFGRTDWPRWRDWLPGEEP
jgi:hypothetical protein